MSKPAPGATPCIIPNCQNFPSREAPLDTGYARVFLNRAGLTTKQIRAYTPPDFLTTGRTARHEESLRQLGRMYAALYHGERKIARSMAERLSANLPLLLENDTSVEADYIRIFLDEVSRDTLAFVSGQPANVTITSLLQLNQRIGKKYKRHRDYINYASSLVTEGNVLMVRGDYKEAVRLFQTALYVIEHCSGAKGNTAAVLHRLCLYLLVRIFSGHLQLPEKAEPYLLRLRKLTEEVAGTLDDEIIAELQWHTRTAELRYALSAYHKKGHNSALDVAGNSADEARKHFALLGHPSPYYRMTLLRAEAELFPPLDSNRAAKAKQDFLLLWPTCPEAYHIFQIFQLEKCRPKLPDVHLNHQMFLNPTTPILWRLRPYTIV